VVGADVVVGGSTTEFGALLRSLRVARGWSQNKLGQRAQVSERAIADLEAGRRRAPFKDTVNLLADALNLSPAERATFEASVNRRRPRRADILSVTGQGTLNFGQLLAHHRVSAGLTQAALGDEAGVSAGDISDMERGLAVAPQSDTIERLADAMRLAGAQRVRLEAAARQLEVATVTTGAASPDHAGTANELTYRVHQPFTATRSATNHVQIARSGVGGRAGTTQLRSVWAVMLCALVLAVVSAAAQPSLIGPTPVRGGTWTEGLPEDPTSMIPNGGGDNVLSNIAVDQALYLPLFYGDAQGQIHPGAATEIPTLDNGGISADAREWTFHVRPGLVWSDGQPYDARDVDYTWRLWSDPRFDGAFPLATTNSPIGYQRIGSAAVSADHSTITFQLKQPDTRFLLLWVDGVQAPLPAHHFKVLTANHVQRTPDELNPSVTSGPFMMADSEPGDHYTLVRNPRYYRASQGEPYLDQLVFRIGTEASILSSFRDNTIDSAQLTKDLIDLAYQRLDGYRLVNSPTSASFEALFFNFHNKVLADHLEVREAIARAIDQEALINGPLHGMATALCTDHPSALHPGYQPGAYCPAFGVDAANKILDDAGWVPGSDGVRSKAGQRLEFEYSTAIVVDSWREGVQILVRQDLAKIGIKLDIQNYPGHQFFNSVLASGRASPPTGAVAGSFDIAEFGWVYGYDADDSSLFGCHRLPPDGDNYGSYCNQGLDALFRQELATQDPGLRQNLYDQIHEIYLRDLPFITLFSPDSISVITRRAHNDEPSPILGDTNNVWDWWCDQGTC
jgi:peptide/nickel transport system substrate-binding protein